MTSSLLILAAAVFAAPPLLVVGEAGTTIDGRASGEAAACELLRGGEARLSLEANATANFGQLEKALPALERCGLERLGFFTTEEPEPLWVQIAGARGPLVVVDNHLSAYVVAEGAMAQLAWNNRAARTWFWQAFSTDHELTLLANPELSLLEYVDAAKALTGERGEAVRLLTSGATHGVGASEALIVKMLRGEAVEMPKAEALTPPSGFLTRWLGHGRAPEVREVRVPRWTNVGALFCRSKGEPVMWGVGVVHGIRNPSFARDAASTKARASLAKLEAVTIQKHERGLSSNASGTLSGVGIIAHWTDPRDDGHYALAATSAGEFADIAKNPCPSDDEVIEELAWREVDPWGGRGTDEPFWSKLGFHVDGEEMGLTVAMPSHLPFARAEQLADPTARHGLAAVLDVAIRNLASNHDRTIADHCLFDFHWGDAAVLAETKTWWNIETSQLYGHACIRIEDIERAMEPSCAEPLIKHFVEVAGRETNLARLAGILGPTGAGADSTPRAPPRPAAPVVIPDWVARGTGSFVDRGESVFFGVGSASGINNLAMARDVAAGRARTEIAELFKTYSAHVLEDFAASGKKKGKAAPAQPRIETAIESFGATTISAVEIVAHWTDPRGTVYSLARLSLEAFKSYLEKTNDFDEKAKRYLLNNLDRIHAGSRP